jgi:predicted nucleic acid-binding protein
MTPPKKDIPVALLDANVLYPAPLRDSLMHLAVTVPLEVRWTEIIQQEWVTNLLEARPNLEPQRLERTVQQMNKAVPNALIHGYETLIEGLNLPDLEDRHVLAAAIHGGAKIIVTNNLKDFPQRYLKQWDIKALKPDAYIIEVVEAAPEAALHAFKLQRANLKSPAVGVSEFLTTLELQSLHQVVGWLKQQRL